MTQPWPRVEIGIGGKTKEEAGGRTIGEEWAVVLVEGVVTIEQTLYHRREVRPKMEGGQVKEPLADCAGRTGVHEV